MLWAVTDVPRHAAKNRARLDAIIAGCGTQVRCFLGSLLVTQMFSVGSACSQAEVREVEASYDLSHLKGNEK